MKLDSRLKKLEEKAGNAQKLWAVFTMKTYSDLVEKEDVKKRLLDEYLSQGNSPPIGCLYFNEIIGPAPYGNRDAFLFSSPTNPLEDIMNRIAKKASDAFDDPVEAPI